MIFSYLSFSKAFIEVIISPAIKDCIVGVGVSFSFIFIILFSFCLPGYKIKFFIGEFFISFSVDDPPEFKNILKL